MNCFFCNHILFNEDIHCYNDSCRGVSVCHFYRENPDDGGKMIYKAEFNTKLNGKTYFISYVINPMRGEQVCCKISTIQSNKKEESAWFETILVLQYPPINLTPFNYQSKLKTILTFS